MFLDLRLAASSLIKVKDSSTSIKKLRSAYVEFACAAECTSTSDTIVETSAEPNTVTPSATAREEPAQALHSEEDSLLDTLLSSAAEVEWVQNINTSPIDDTQESMRDRLAREHGDRFDSVIWKEWIVLATQVFNASIASAKDVGKLNQPASGRCICAHLWKLMQYNVCDEYKRAELQKDKYGYMPALAFCIIGGCLSESYCERVLSQANLVLTKGNTRLSTEKVRKLVVLRMNEQFIRWAKKRNGEQIRNLLAGMRHDVDAPLQHQTRATG